MPSREEERFSVQLGLLVESSGRVQTTVGRIMRWGLGSVDVVTGVSNRDALLRELDDVKVSVCRIERELTAGIGDLPIAPVVNGRQPAFRGAPSCGCGFIFESATCGRTCPNCGAMRERASTLADGTRVVEANDVGE